MFHKNLKSIRIKNGLSQKQIANYLNISPQSISKWEKGDASPSIEFLPKLAECLSCEINDFFAKETNDSWDYSMIYDIFALEAACIYDGIPIDNINSYVKSNPETFNIAINICEQIKEQKILNAKNIQVLLSCSKEEAYTFITLLKRHEILDKIDKDDSYIVIKDAVDGLIILLNQQQRLYATLYR